MPFSRLTRRTALQASGSVILAWAGGCASIPGSKGPSTDTRIPTATPPESAAIQRRITVARQVEVPADADVALNVQMLSPFVTRHDPARIRIAFTNTADVERRFTFGSGPPFTRFGSIEPADGSELLLLPADADHEKVTPDCWRPATETIFIAKSIQRKLTLQPGETIAAEKAVWDSNQNESAACLVPGEYRFENSYGLPDGTNLVWGFTLLIEE